MFGKYKHQILSLYRYFKPSPLPIYDIEDCLPIISSNVLDRYFNEYCKPYNSEEDLYRNIILVDYDDRRRFINFAACSKHGTVEFRIFPGIGHPLELLIFASIVIEVLDYINEEYMKSVYPIYKVVG